MFLHFFPVTQNFVFAIIIKTAQLKHMDMDFPQEILFFIITYLDEESIHSLRVTNKRFRDLCSDKTSFIWEKKSFPFKPLFPYQIYRTLLHYPHLKELDLTGCRCVNTELLRDGFTKLSFAKEGTLRFMIISGTPMLAEPVLPNFARNLKYLELTDCPYLTIVTFEQNNCLEELVIRNCPCFGAGVAKVTNIPFAPLKKLTITTDKPSSCT